MPGITRLYRNHYYAMRHGQSQANLAGVIVSDPGMGTTGYGLTESGKHQVRESARSFQLAPAKLHIYSSDFLRAQETANLVHGILQPPFEVTLSVLLRERFFGELEGQIDSAYQDVWSLDAIDPNHKQRGVESVTSVLARATELLENLESKYRGENILLVAHGDVLQILQTAFERVPPSKHRQLPHLQVAEIRRLNPPLFDPASPTHERQSLVSGSS